MRWRERGEVYGKALAVSLALYALTVVVKLLCQPLIRDRVLCWAAAFAAVEMALILSLSFSLVAVRAYARFREHLNEQLRPAMRDRVLALAFEGERWSTAVPRRGVARQVLEESVAEALTSIKAGGRERVAEFANEHGLAAGWTEGVEARSKQERKRAVSLLGLLSPEAGEAVAVRALADREPAVRAAGYRALLAGGRPENAARVFRALLEETLLMRALLADELKRHSGYLLANTVPALLEHARSDEAGHCLEILIAWQRALPGFDVTPWLADGEDAALRSLLLALLPYVWTDSSIEEYVGAALGSGNVEVQCAAARAAGRLKLERLIPELEAALGASRRVALAAAHALAEIGGAGEQSLEKSVAGANRGAAAVALDALEHATVRTR